MIAAAYLIIVIGSRMPLGPIPMPDLETCRREQEIAHEKLKTPLVSISSACINTIPSPPRTK